MVSACYTLLLVSVHPILATAEGFNASPYIPLTLCAEVNTATAGAEVDVRTLAVLGFGLHPPLLVRSGGFGGWYVSLTAIADRLASPNAVGIVFLHVSAN